jgi:uncharacterized protein YidB (DUF937 family)
MPPSRPTTKGKTVPDRKLLTAAALTAALAAGGAGGVLLGRPLVSDAQQEDPTTTEAPADEGRFVRGPRAGLEAAAEALGMGVDELRDALRDGSTIADVAGERGVDVQAVIDAMVADATERIDQRVADGDLDADRAAELKEELPERITDVVNGEARLGHHHRGPGFGFGGVPAAAEALGMSVEDLRTALRDGQTIAQVAEERGVDLQTVVDAIVEEATEDIEERVDDFVNGELPDGPGPRGGLRAGLAAAAEALGMEADELRDALRDDSTIADVAGERGVDVQAVIDAMVADATERIDQRVADGDLDADRAAELKAELPERITDVVNGEGPRGGPGFGHGPGGPGFGE